MSDKTAFEVGRLYAPVKQIADTLTASQQDLFVRLPGLQGYWPMGIRFSSGAVVEHGGAGNSLLQTGTCPVGFDGDSYAHLGDGTNYLYASGGFGITGLEAFITSSMRGLTLGGWFMIDGWPVQNSGLVTKFGSVTNYGYGLSLQSTGEIFAIVSSNGSATTVAQSQVAAMGEWHFLALRFIPSTEVAVFVDGDKTVNPTAVPASIFVSSQNFEVGRYQGADSRITHGKSRDVFVCSASLSDALIEQTRVTSAP